MKNKIIIFLVLFIPLAVFILLEYFSNSSKADAFVPEESLGKAKLIKFYSPMCSECKTVAKNIEAAMDGYEELIILEEINAGNADKKTKAMLSKYKITVVPTVVFVDKQGKTTRKNEGMIDTYEIKQCLDEIK